MMKSAPLLLVCREYFLKVDKKNVEKELYEIRIRPEKRNVSECLLINLGSKVLSFPKRIVKVRGQDTKNIPIKKRYMLLMNQLSRKI